MATRISRYIEAIDAEITFLKKERRDQVFDLTAGQRDENSKGFGGVYVFLLTDPLRLPDDATGHLRLGDRELPAMVVGQEGNRLWVLIETTETLPGHIGFARLVLSQTELLERLKERLAEMSGDGGIAAAVFDDRPIRTSWADLGDGPDAGGSSEHKLVLQQAIGSEVTFVWGPPGTGKTYSIASLVAKLVEQGETVLVTSHTHAAVEQALWAAIEPPTDGREGGPLHGSKLVSEGKLLKVGPLRQAKIPPECHLDSFLKAKADERQQELAECLGRHKELGRHLDGIRAEIVPWLAIEESRRSLKQAQEAHAKTVAAHEAAEREVADLGSRIETAQGSARSADKSFFLGRKRRVSRAQEAVQSLAQRLRAAEAARTKLAGGTRTHGARVLELEAVVVTRTKEAQGLRPLDQLTSIEAGLSDEGLEVEREIAELRETDTDWATMLLDQAKGVFATLTKLYMDPHLRAREWDTVVLDEVSMAMPPLVYFASARAGRRVVLVGDFYQLPPIVQSREGIAVDQLGRDVFDCRGIPEAVENGKNPTELARLSSQRRMVPAIAEVARALAYRQHLVDHDSVRTRPSPQWCSALGTDDPLVILDIAALNTWAGKMPGSMSRFNFYSAQAAVEVAALYAAQLEQPEETAPPMVGIVTPYSAQRRYLSRLIQSASLERWVTAGTVHTFQGGEYDVIIFDSVLAEPHWTARLTNPHEWNSVRRDLNVAVTRARHQFVFIGDGRWLDRHATANSGYGRLWSHLKAVAHSLDALDHLGPRFSGRVAAASSSVLGWDASVHAKDLTFLDETSFYRAFTADLAETRQQALLFTPFIGKTRWPLIQPHIAGLLERGVETFIFHKPLSDPEWRRGDTDFGRSVFAGLEASGARLIPLSGVHAKTIVLDRRIVYEGSLNWASQTSSYEHMWRIESGDMATLVQRMLQLRSVIETFGASDNESYSCPKCGGPLVLVNQAQPNARFADRQPLKLGCYNHSVDKKSCQGYLRRVDGRAPFTRPPLCEKGSERALVFTANGRPWAWRCGHKSCGDVRWSRGDVVP